ALFSLEARAGIRYQRTEVNGEVNVGGLVLQTPDSVDDGSDAILGTRAVLRPTHWLWFSGVFDYGVIGASDPTSSPSAHPRRAGGGWPPPMRACACIRTSWSRRAGAP